jgi:hypothetical protein
MSKQLIIKEVYDNAINRLIKAELLVETLLELSSQYENLLSQTIVTSYKCKSISKILNQEFYHHMNENYLLEQLKLSKRMYNKISYNKILDEIK